MNTQTYKNQYVGYFSAHLTHWLKQNSKNFVGEKFRNITTFRLIALETRLNFDTCQHLEKLIFENFLKLLWAVST